MRRSGPPQYDGKQYLPSFNVQPPLHPHIVPNGPVNSNMVEDRSLLSRSSPTPSHPPAVLGVGIDGGSATRFCGHWIYPDDPASSALSPGFNGFLCPPRRHHELRPFRWTTSLLHRHISFPPSYQCVQCGFIAVRFPPCRGEASRFPFPHQAVLMSLYEVIDHPYIFMDERCSV